MPFALSAPIAGQVTHPRPPNLTERRGRQGEPPSSGPFRTGAGLPSA